MKNLFLIGLVSTIALSPAAFAAQSLSTSASMSAEGSTAQFERGEKRKGNWVRGQGAVNRDDSAGRSEQRSRRIDRPAQDRQRSERGDDRRGDWRQSRQQQPQVQQSSRAEISRRGDDSHRSRRNDDHGRWRGRDDSHRDDSRRWEGRRDNDQRAGERHRYDRRDNDRWDRSWRSDRRYNWRGHRERYRSYYRPGRYYAPNRYDRYRRFSIGIYLGSPFYSNRYWISDPWYYRLPPAHGPYRWVRYYDDVLLIDVRNGYVVDVIHDFFW